MRGRLLTRHCRIIDRSGWLNHGRHQFVLMEEERPEGAEGNPTKFVMVIIVEQWGQELAHKIVEDSMGPLEVDCPLRIMKKLEGSPPTGEFSRNWRANVLQYHQEMGPRKSVLRKLRKEYPRGESRVILRDGRQVNYEQGKYRGRRNTSAYWDPKGNGSLTLLSPGGIDAASTRALWEKREDEEGAETQQQQGQEREPVPQG